MIMEIKGRISIKGQRMSVSSMMSESFVYEASDMTSHVVSVNMSDGGKVSIKIDGIENSSYRKEIMESHSIDIYVEKLHKRLAKAYESISDYYLKMHAQSEKTWKKKDIKNQLQSLKCENYEAKPFELEKPTIAEIESDLRADAEVEGIIDQNGIAKYVASHLEDSFNYRLSKWENLKRYHAYVQSVIGRSVNERNRMQFEIRKNAFHAIIDGDPTYISKKIKELEETLILPYSTDFDYVFSPDSGVLDIDMESPLIVNIPQKKVYVSDSGELQIVKTTPTEDKINQTRSKISSIFYIAWSLWNISTKIRRITIKNWQIKNQIGICWFSLDRSYFENIDPGNVDIIELSKEVQHVIDIKDNSISTLRYNLFQYAINEGRYDDATLLKFANTANRIANTPNSKGRIELPKVENGEMPSSINDLDYGYNLSVKPIFDYSFANWCMELVNYKECSLELFVKEFGMSLDRAKDFMGKLLFLHFVGGKYDDGRRKVLISSENELEYKLSWVYPNESWKH